MVLHGDNDWLWWAMEFQTGGGDDGTHTAGSGKRLREHLLLFEHPAHRGRSQVQSSPAEHLGDLDLAQSRAEELQALGYNLCWIAGTRV